MAGIPHHMTGWGGGGWAGGRSAATYTHRAQLGLAFTKKHASKKLFGPLLDDLDYVSAVKEAMELQVEACM